MICRQCGAQNAAEVTYCKRCGADLYSNRQNDGWFEKVGAVVLLIIFLPVGLCGLVTTIGAVSAIPNPGPDPFYVYTFGGFGAACLLVAGFVTYWAVRKLTRK